MIIEFGPLLKYDETEEIVYYWDKENSTGAGRDLIQDYIDGDRTYLRPLTVKELDKELGFVYEDEDEE